jgi:ABC-type xylose transport system permease subunit
VTTPAEQKNSSPARRPQAANLRRLTIIAAVAFVLLLADALYMKFANYQQGTYNNFHLDDATTVFIAAGFLAVITLVLVGLSRRAARDER